MVKTEHKRVDDPEVPDDPEIAQVKQATKQGTIEVVQGVMNDPQVQQIIKTALLKETIKNSIVLACLMIGLLKLYDVTKTVVGFNWIGDLTISLILIFIGLGYILSSTCKGKNKWSTNDKSQQS